MTRDNCVTQSTITQIVYRYTVTLIDKKLVTIFCNLQPVECWRKKWWAAWCKKYQKSPFLPMLAVFFSATRFTRVSVHSYSESLYLTTQMNGRSIEWGRKKQLIFSINDPVPCFVRSFSVCSDVWFVACCWLSHLTGEGVQTEIWARACTSGVMGGAICWWERCITIPFKSRITYLILSADKLKNLKKD